ncbi:MAG: chromosome segregation protein SMC, partial [Patescibacteria group bacterium]
GEEIMKEFRETSERDIFLERELADLRTSSQSLKQLLAELEERLNMEFKEGIEKINKAFNNFFSLMFGGGKAELIVENHKAQSAKQEFEEGLAPRSPEEDEVGEEGIEINVSLPKKRIKGLQMLSGGERALTSIALLFAMSQVNPPPFIILDETDAALDEANSKKYGDMIESLSKHSQLILITHNRETMSRAGVIYGVTMGSNGVSRLLSIAFDEAVVVAK